MDYERTIVSLKENLKEKELETEEQRNERLRFEIRSKRLMQDYKVKNQETKDLKRRATEVEKKIQTKREELSTIRTEVAEKQVLLEKTLGTLISGISLSVSFV